MAKVERFEDFQAWQRSMDFVVRVYEFSAIGKFARDFALSDQIHRAAISVPANISEGFERGSRSEFHRFLSISKGSCGELRTHIYLAERLGYITPETAQSALTEVTEIIRMISKLRTTVARQRDAQKK
jgi:four helix bundle protein